ncbi:MAG: PD-(D/E)XK nuclease family protein [Lyngbya sp.]|nr:PD-(D/E)XK nuclease family protein [Lyngbya sp.]
MLDHSPLPAYKAKYVRQNGQLFYQVPTGESYPGVTKIIQATEPFEDKLPLLKWKQRVGQETAQKISSQSSRRGTKLHQLISKKLTGEEPEFIPDELQGFWNSIYPFLDDKIEQSLLVESLVWNSPNRYAGKLDCLAIIAGEITLCDWKTARRPRQNEWNRNYYLQCAAYAKAIEQVYTEFDIKVEQALVVVALPDEKAQVFCLESQYLREYWREFQSRLELFYQV